MKQMEKGLFSNLHSGPRNERIHHRCRPVLGPNRIGTGHESPLAANWAQLTDPPVPVPVPVRVDLKLKSSQMQTFSLSSLSLSSSDNNKFLQLHRLQIAHSKTTEHSPQSLTMNQLDRVNNSNAPPNNPVKRNRGRPRNDQSLKRRVVAPMPPGFEAKANGNQPHQHVIDNANDGMVGQTVTGVVQAAFDSGYLLTVRIGNSNASLSGVVFTPGNFVPISKENDVAPNVRTITRNEVFFPMENQTRKRRPRSKGSTVQHHGLRGVETIHLSNGLTVSNIVKPPPGLRGTVVPVVLQPVNLSNGLLTANQVPPVPSQANHVEAMKMTVGSHNQNDPLHQGLDGKSLAEDSGRGLEGDSMNEPLFLEPLQIIDFDIPNQMEPVAKPSGDNYRMGMGKMTALLQGNRTEPGA
ncbi:hypothetical protein RHGRI_018609 [Rhododendron griersonianum]|uniref:AT hook motif-containing protein n=1 Tax=Rhododendron griersonianum TaxID=479676 RepID=A0AAV6K2B8_9ERIC|nr:hypothetical protein RHGRI_018609 [Rhododendron griersonianum]